MPAWNPNTEESRSPTVRRRSLGRVNANVCGDPAIILGEEQRPIRRPVFSNAGPSPPSPIPRNGRHFG